MRTYNIRYLAWITVPVEGENLDDAVDKSPYLTQRNLPQLLADGKADITVEFDKRDTYSDDENEG